MAWKIIISLENGQILDTVDNATDGHIFCPNKDYKYYYFVVDGKINVVRNVTFLEAGGDGPYDFLIRLEVPNGTEKIKIPDSYLYAVPLKNKKKSPSKSSSKS